jgi:hypothetical protein
VGIVSCKVYNIIHDAPSDEIELGNGGAQGSTGTRRELDAIGPAKGIKELLGVAHEARLVRHVDRKLSARLGHVGPRVLAGHEAFEGTQRYTTLVIKHINEHLGILGIGIKLAQVRQ